MATFIKPVECLPIEFDKFLDELDEMGSKLFSDENLERTVELLQRLQANRHFLTAYIRKYILDLELQASNPYTGQILILAEREHFIVRAPIWVPMNEMTDARMFAYDFPHDHDFDLLTIGYVGSGYSTDIYEYDCRNVSGSDGEVVELGLRETYQLSEGSSLLMRANKDIHTQRPPDELSVSLNILKSSGRTNKQFSFDIENGSIVKPVSLSIFDAVTYTAGLIGNENIKSEVKKFLEVN